MRKWKRGELLVVTAGVLAFLLFVVYRAKTPAGPRIPVQESFLTLTGLASTENGFSAAQLFRQDWSQCLTRFHATHSRPLRITFVGHSRARHLFNILTGVTSTRFLTRADTVAEEFLDMISAGETGAWSSFTSGSSTCLGVWPKPRHNASSPAHAWCSRQVSGRLMHATFRWRHSLHQLTDALRRTASAYSPPDLLVATQGLHLAAVVPFQHAAPLYHHVLARLEAPLRQLTALGTRVLWLPEISGSPAAGGRAHSDDALAINALTAELWPPRRRSLGTPLGWTAALATAADLWTRVCTWQLATRTATRSQRHLCATETYHVDDATARATVAQLLNAVCAAL